MRHGLTLGELAALVNLRMAGGDGGAVERSDGVAVRCPGRCALRVVPMEGWRRRMLFPDTGLPWVLPSPNMPTFETAVVYPGQVLLEGTNVSEGRGTTRPFEIFGAPWIDLATVRARFARRRLPGVVLRDHAFEPTFHKWAGQVCRGFQLHVTDRAAFRPYATTLALLQDIRALPVGPSRRVEALARLIGHVVELDLPLGVPGDLGDPEGAEEDPVDAQVVVAERHVVGLDPEVAAAVVLPPEPRLAGAGPF